MKEDLKYLVEEDHPYSGGELHGSAITSPARMIFERERRPFQAAIGIPRGGVELGKWLKMIQNTYLI